MCFLKGKSEGGVQVHSRCPHTFYAHTQSLARRCLLPDRHARPTTKELVQALGAMANKYGTV